MHIDNKRKIFNLKSKPGFAILFSILLASFLITLGISIFSISLKEIMITTSARDSQIAYYVADSARECALYYDSAKAAFPTCLNADCSEKTELQNPITCNGNDINLTFNHLPGSLTYSAIQSKFFQASSSISSPVADIIITKSFIPSDGSIMTRIEARGYNTGIIGRRVERALLQVI